MTYPELLVDEPDELQHLLPAPVRNLEIEGAGDVHGLDVLDPGEGDVIVGPAARDRHRHLVGLGAVEDPIPKGGEPLHDIEGMFGTIDVDLELGHVDPWGSGERAKVRRPEAFRRGD